LSFEKCPNQQKTGFSFRWAGTKKAVVFDGIIDFDVDLLAGAADRHYSHFELTFSFTRFYSLTPA
tara:strand:- start:474 stop:668 length:195 start_codon:yes stop_codon:yes gene_type:complete